MVGLFKRGGSMPITKIRNMLASILSAYVNALNEIIIRISEDDRIYSKNAVNLLIARELSTLLATETRVLKQLETERLPREVRGVIDDLVRNIEDAVIDLEYYESKNMDDY